VENAWRDDSIVSLMSEGMANIGRSEDGIGDDVVFGDMGAAYATTGQREEGKTS